MGSYGTEVADITPDEVVPVQMLRDSTPDIANRELLDERYEREGYLLFCGLLPKDAIERTRKLMLKPLVAAGLVEEQDGQPIWTGGDRPSLGEESPEFQGICKAFFESPGVKDALNQLLGEPVSLMPMVQYRAYRPNGPLGRVHQDGYFSPGIEGYRPIWVPLVEMDEEVGGLALAVGMTGQGYFHNTDKMPMARIPTGIIPPSSWARFDYKPGDVLVIHPETPHTGLPNVSRRVRLSLDSRVQAEARPSAIAGELVAFDSEHVTLRFDDGTTKDLSIGDDTFIRTSEILGRRLTRQEFNDETQLGIHLMASVKDGRAMMLRRAAMV